jgi:virginiamycin B lyase
MRVLIAAGLCLVCALALTAAPDERKTADGDKKKSGKSAPATPAAPKSGVKTPGVQIPFENLKAEAQIPVETPGLITVPGSIAPASILVPNKSKDLIVRIDAKTNTPVEPIANLKQPCSGAIAAFGTLWVAGCEAKTLARVDPKTGKITSTLAIGAADVMTGLVATPDSIWMFTDSKTTLSRIDPEDNKVVEELRLPANCNSLAYGENSLWVTCPSEPRILRINPATNLVDKRIEVSAGPRAVAFGANSVWVLCEKEGKVERIDPKTNKVVKTIDLAVPNAAGNLAFGDGFLWVTQIGFPLTRIDPENDKERVAQQFWGDGGGLISIAPGAIWLSNVNKGSVRRIDPKRVIATLAE